MWTVDEWQVIIISLKPFTMLSTTILLGTSRVNPSPAELRYALPLQTFLKKPADPDLHYLPINI